MLIAKRNNNASIVNPAAQQSKKSINNVYNIEKLKISCILTNISLMPDFSLIQKILVFNHNDLHLNLVCNHNDLHLNLISDHNDLHSNIL